jgi:threonine dehydratase
MSRFSPTVVAEAAQRLAGIVNQTPVMTSRTLNELVGCEVFLKCENFQRVGAFKFRGAYNAISQLSEAQKAAGVITHSSGNHAQGVALAARLLDVKAVIVMPEDAPPVKRAATADYGAEIFPCAAVEREKVSADLARQHGYTLIHPYDNPDVIAGQGTAAWELFSEVGQLDTLFVPVGGGGLISGSALAAAGQSPQCRVVGVEPETAADANQSWRNNEIVTLPDVPDTIADGLRTRAIGAHNLAIMRQYVHDMTTVSEEAILRTLEFVWSRLKILIEPSAAVALAPLLTGGYTKVGQRVGVIFSGGNASVQLSVNSKQLSVSSKQLSVNSDRLSVNSDRSPLAPNRPRVLVTATMAEEALAILRQTAELDIEPHLSQEQLLNRIGQYQALIADAKTRVGEQVIEYGFNLRAIGNISARLDNVDVSTARNMGIELCSAPSGTAVAIAEHTMGQLLTVTRHFGDGRLAGRTLGLIGFGRVAREVVRRARAFDMRILVNQPLLTPQLAMSAGVEVVDLMALLPQADFVSLHVPFREETATLIGLDELKQMKPTACLINTGHTDLVDDAALFEALRNGRLAGASLPDLPIHLDDPVAHQLRQLPQVLVAPHISTIIGSQQRDMALAVAEQIATILQTSQVQETLSLELVPTELIIPHEQIDEKRVARLMGRLEADGRLVNPPVTTFWEGNYIVLDGATRSTAFKRLGYPYVIVQVVDARRDDYELHTWYHAISGEQSFARLRDHLQTIDQLSLAPLAAHQLQGVFNDPNTLCYFLDREGKATLAQVATDQSKLQVMNDLVASYTAWGQVERTLLTDLSRLLAQFPQMTAVAIFPQFKAETVFKVASRGDLLPAGLTRFIIPGRILRLNADLERLKRDEPLAEKRAWFNQFLAEKLARSRLRYYQEPVILLDE